MKKIGMLILFCLLSGWFASYAFAVDGTDNANRLPVMHQVTFNLSAERWLMSQTVKVIVVVDAMKTQAQLANAQEKITQTLQKIAPNSTWHITEFNRSESKAKLEQLQVAAEARLPYSAIANIREQAAKVSQQGETYTVMDISYAPTQQEIAAAMADMRSNIYQQAKDELDRLNKLYPEAHYVLHEVRFNPTYQAPVAMASASPRFLATGDATAMQNKSQANEIAPSAPAVSASSKVSQYLSLQADITLASTGT